jgi:hypothetical protein
MTIFTAAIANVSPDPEVYGGLAAAANYVGALFSTQADTWLALDANTKARTLRAATLYLERILWDGDRTGLVGVDATTLQWPRSGVELDGVAIDATTVPVDIVSAAFELAVLINADPDLVTAVDQGSLVSSVGAGGGVSVSFAFPTSAALGTATRFPTVVQQLIGKYLAVPAAAIAGGTGAYGCSTSAYSRARQFTLVRPE